MRASLNAELNLSWSAPLWAEYTHGYDESFAMVAFEPTFDLDIGFYMKIAFHLYFIEWEFSVDLLPYKFRPFDFTLQIDPYHPKRYCFGFDYWTKGLALEIYVE